MLGATVELNVQVHPHNSCITSGDRLQPINVDENSLEDFKSTEIHLEPVNLISSEKINTVAKSSQSFENFNSATHSAEVFPSLKLL